LTIKQHVFPLKSIARFTDATGTVSLSDLSRKRSRRAKPSDDIFCAKRAWSERAEAGYMKKIEDAFQKLADSILNGSTEHVRGDDVRIVCNFFALWYMRARHRELPMQEIQMHGATGGGLTPDQEELLEKRGYTFLRQGGKMSARHINGLQLQMKLYRYSEQLQATAQLGVIQTLEGEFIVPDTPSHFIVPLTPTVCLISPSPNGTIRRSNLAEINQILAISVERYFFAHDLSKCPF
jgi:hypothetical protein